MEQESSTKKPWHKTWWGILMMIAFLPVTLIYLVWRKTEWKSYIKGVATAGILLFTISAMASTGNPPAASPVDTQTPQAQEEATIKQEEQKTEAPVEAKVEEPATVVPAPVVEEVVPEPEVAQSSCDSNYAGACVPIDIDVDCASGNGNGPSYVQGPVTVIGTDVYKLDTDHDGIGCES